MIDPKIFKESLRHESLEEIIKARDSLIRKKQKYERDGPEDTEITMDPGPDVVYYCNLSYLSEICGLIQEKIHEEQERY